MAVDPARDCPACPNCGLEVGTPIRDAEIQRWDGEERATLFCPACGHGWVGTPEDVERAVKSWRAYEAETDGEPR